MDQAKITFENLPEAIEILMKEVSQLKKSIMALKPSTKSQPLPIEIDDACKITLKSKSTIYRLVRQGKIPHCKIGNKLYFFENELLDWITSNIGKTNSITKKDIELQMTQKIKHKPKQRNL